jgi:hypothetical protein
MDNDQIKRVRLAQVEAAKEYQPFHKLMEKKELYKDLKRHPGYKVLEVYLEELLSQYKDSLSYAWINNTGKDISDVLRGKIMILNEVLKLSDAIDGMIKMREEIKNLPKEEKGAL